MPIRYDVCPTMLALMLVAGLAPTGLAAQQPDPRQPSSPRATSAPAVVQSPGQAATPQLITVRPREQLRFDGQLVVPLYYNRTFWPSILAGYDIATPRVASLASDSASAPAPRAAPAVSGPPRRAPVRTPP